MKRFSVIAIDSTGRVPGIMGYSDTIKEALEIQELATRNGWLAATIRDFEEFEPPTFSK
ncbi:MAG: hypothetical protein ABSF15_22125 [Candidatus Sulfotelmatobacter sp.]|jgi:hypothetical protein